MEGPPSAPLDVQAIAATLRGGKASDKWVRSWLPDTCADPERFLGSAATPPPVPA